MQSTRKSAGTIGVDARIRHPQYTGFVLVMPAFPSQVTDAGDAGAVSDPRLHDVKSSLVYARRNPGAGSRLPAANISCRFAAARRMCKSWRPSSACCHNLEHAKVGMMIRYRVKA